MYNINDNTIYNNNTTNTYIYIYIYIYIRPNGRLAEMVDLILQGSMPFRAAQFKQFLELLARNINIYIYIYTCIDV